MKPKSSLSKKQNYESVKHFKEITELQRIYHEAIYKCFCEEIERILIKSIPKLPFFLQNFGKETTWALGYSNKL